MPCVAQAGMALRARGAEDLVGAEPEAEPRMALTWALAGMRAKPRSPFVLRSAPLSSPPLPTSGSANGQPCWCDGETEPLPLAQVGCATPSFRPSPAAACKCRWFCLAASRRSLSPSAPPSPGQGSRRHCCPESHHAFSCVLRLCYQPELHLKLSLASTRPAHCSSDAVFGTALPHTLPVGGESPSPLL